MRSTLQALVVTILYIALMVSNRDDYLPLPLLIAVPILTSIATMAMGMSAFDPEQRYLAPLLLSFILAMVLAGVIAYFGLRETFEHFEHHDFEICIYTAIHLTSYLVINTMFECHRWIHGSDTLSLGHLSPDQLKFFMACDCWGSQVSLSITILVAMLSSPLEDDWWLYTATVIICSWAVVIMHSYEITSRVSIACGTQNIFRSLVWITFILSMAVPGYSCLYRNPSLLLPGLTNALLVSYSIIIDFYYQGTFKPTTSAAKSLPPPLTHSPEAYSDLFVAAANQRNYGTVTTPSAKATSIRSDSSINSRCKDETDEELGEAQEELDEAQEELDEPEVRRPLGFFP